MYYLFPASLMDKSFIKVNDIQRDVSRCKNNKIKNDPDNHKQALLVVSFNDTQKEARERRQRQGDESSDF
jgi:hypothetical protein